MAFSLCESSVKWGHSVKDVWTGSNDPLKFLRTLNSAILWLNSDAHIFLHRLFWGNHSSMPTWTVQTVSPFAYDMSSSSEQKQSLCPETWRNMNGIRRNSGTVSTLELYFQGISYLARRWHSKGWKLPECPTQSGQQARKLCLGQQGHLHENWSGICTRMIQS